MNAATRDVILQAIAEGIDNIDTDAFGWNRAEWLQDSAVVVLESLHDAGYVVTKLVLPAAGETPIGAECAPGVRPDEPAPVGDHRIDVV